MRKIHSFESFNKIYEADSSLGVASTDESKLYDQTLGLIITTILNSYGSLLYFPVESYSQNIDPDLSSVKSASLSDKVAAFSKIMAEVKSAAADNKFEGSQEAVDAWIQAGTKAAEALGSIINRYKDQEDEKEHINKFVNVSIDRFMEEISDASRENELKKDLASVKESYEYIFEGLLKGKKGMIEDVSKKITLVMAKLGSLANTPGMSSEVQKLQSEVAGIAAQMGELLNKKNKEINKEDIKKADTRLTEIPTVLDKLAERMLKQDSTNKEAASILVQAFNLVQAAKEKEKVYISKKEEAEREAEAKATVLYDIEKIKDVNPTVKKFQELVISKLGKNKQISSLASFKKMGTDGKYGPATKQMVQIVKSGFNLRDTSGEKITSEVIRELERQSPLTESRIYSFGKFSDYLLEDFDVEKATMVAKSLNPISTSPKQSKKSSPSMKAGKLFKEGSKGDVVVAINRIVGQTSDEKNYTEETVQKVKDFQEINDLYVDGIVGEDTLNKLYDTRVGADSQAKLNDPKSPRGQQAYKILADALGKKYSENISGGKQSLSNLGIQKIANDLISASNGSGTAEGKVLTSIEKLKNKKDFDILNNLIKRSFSLARNPSELSKIGIKDGSNYRNIQDLINGEMGSDDIGTVKSIKDYLNKIGVSASYKYKTESGNFIEGSFIIK